MVDETVPLTPEEEQWKREVEEEDARGVPGIEAELPAYVPLPVEGDDVVAEILPKIGN